MSASGVFGADEAGRDDERVAALERRIRIWREIAQLSMVMALGSFPIVAAYHIDLEPALRLTVDLGSGLWAMLPLGALVSGLNVLRLGWRR